MDQKRKTYEGMFLLESGNPDFHSASEPVRDVLARSDAEVLALNPWDDRKLAYDVNGHHRGLYVLAYFKSDPERISEIEHDSQLDERILRLMIVRRDHLTEQEIAAETPAMASARKSAEIVRTSESVQAEAEAEREEPEKTQAPDVPVEEAPAAVEVGAEIQAPEGEAPAENEASPETPQPQDEAQTETPATGEEPVTT